MEHVARSGFHDFECGAAQELRHQARLLDLPACISSCSDYLDSLVCDDAARKLRIAHVCERYQRPCGYLPDFLSPSGCLLRLRRDFYLSIPRRSCGAHVALLLPFADTARGNG